MKLPSFSLFVALIIVSCQDGLPTQQLPRPSADPCATPVAAKYYFTVANQVGDKFFPSDTIFPGTVKLSAPAVYTSVVWRIGNDTRTFTKNNLIFDFPTAIGTITIRFVGTRPVDKCKARDQGIDTLTKSLTVVNFNPRHPHSAIEGVFLGATANMPADTFRVRIFNRQDVRDTASYEIAMYNLNKGCPGLEMNLVPSYRAISFNQTRGDAICHGIYGSGILDSIDRNKIYLKYNEQLTPGQPEYAPRVFIGYRKK